MLFTGINAPKEDSFMKIVREAATLFYLSNAPFSLQNFKEKVNQVFSMVKRLMVQLLYVLPWLIDTGLNILDKLNTYILDLAWEKWNLKRKQYPSVHKHEKKDPHADTDALCLAFYIFILYEWIKIGIDQLMAIAREYCITVGIPFIGVTIWGGYKYYHPSQVNKE